MNISEEVLMGIAAVAIALIGFSGVVTALGRRNSRSWSQSESIQLFALVAPAIVTLASAFIPVGLGLIIQDSEILWRTANGACFFAHLLPVVKFMRDGSTESIRFSHKIGLTITFSVMAVMLASSLGLGEWPQFTFLLGLLLGIGVSLHNFYLLLFPAISSDRD